MNPKDAPLIRKLESHDWPSAWKVLHETCLGGDSFAFLPDITESEMHRIWVEVPLETFGAYRPDGSLVGTYYIKPNQPGLGSHVANCGYAVAAHAQGEGVASAMCEHSQQRAKTLGFRGMQFNMVVSTNERAVRLWQRLGFAIVGTLPGAFRHRHLGFVDAYVMHKPLERSPSPSTPPDAGIRPLRGGEGHPATASN